jgi:predicted AlkP superfamily pyrophosphatase or phosphodiesterase
LVTPHPGSVARGDPPLRSFARALCGTPAAFFDQGPKSTTHTKNGQSDLIMFFVLFSVSSYLRNRPCPMSRLHFFRRREIGRVLHWPAGPSTILLIAAVFVLVSGARATSLDPPKLAVIVVVDQMRADYVDRFQRDWTGGFKRLLDRGAWLRRVAYPYLETVTCAGHATIVTGAFPHTHGIFQNAWWDRDARSEMTCTEDRSTSNVGYGVAVTGGDSAYRLQIPTLVDELRTRLGARVATIALKDRSAIMLAGRGGDAVTWSGEAIDSWQTSKVYSPTTVAPVKAFLEANRVSADFGKTWTRMLPESRYKTPDDGRGEAAPAGWTRTFPHALTGTTGQPDATYFAQWQRSPFADAYVGRFAASLVESLQLGQRETTDFLGISFSSPDLVGHAFGPRSQEVQDMYVRLDRTLATLFERLDALVGRDQWIVALSADHGVTPLPEQLRAAGRDAGRISPAAIANAVEERLGAVLGSGPHVALLVGSDMYFQKATLDRLQASPDLLKSVIKAIASTPGVHKVFRGDEVRDAATSSSPDSLLRAAALSYVPGRSGDLIIVPKEGWMFAQRGTTHGGPFADDQQVPILLMGRGIRPGKYDNAATPADIAPTLAALWGVTLSHAEGRPLSFLLSF